VSSKTILVDVVQKQQGKRTNSYTLSIPQGLSRIKVCLAWTDPPGQPGARTALVNDLDIRLLSPGDKEFLPYTLNKDKPKQKATTGINRIDNIELVELRHPGAGEWTIEVNAAKFGKGTKQEFALAVWSN